jgi:rod shape-determining protein MreC
MEAIISRYRHLTVLLIVIAAQLLLLAYQVKSNEDVRLIRVWAVTAVTPLAKVLESVRSGTTSFFSDYFVLLDVREENRRLKAELARIKMENQFLKTELSTADRARALAAFQSRSPSKTLPARVIGNGTGANSQIVLVDVGTGQGVQNGMAVITPDGIVGKVVRVFPTATQVLLVTDPTFAAGVVSQRNRVHGTLKGQGRPGTLLVDYIQNEQKVEVGEMFFTSGDDRIFPKGIPVGQATVVRPGKAFQEVFVAPTAFQHGLDEVLIVLDGVHVNIPEAPEPQAPPKLLPPPPPASLESSASPGSVPSGMVAPGVAASSGAGGAVGTTGGSATEGDRLLERYRRVGQAQGHVYGSNASGRVPDFNLDPNKVDPGRVDANRPADGSVPTGTLGAGRTAGPQTAPQVPGAKPQTAPAVPSESFAPARPDAAAKPRSVPPPP